MQLEAMYKEWITNAEKALAEAFAITPKEAHKFCGRAEGMQLRTVTLSSVAQSKGEDQGARYCPVGMACGPQARGRHGTGQQGLLDRARDNPAAGGSPRSSYQVRQCNRQIIPRRCRLQSRMVGGSIGLFGSGRFRPKAGVWCAQRLPDEVKAGFAVARRLGN